MTLPSLSARVLALVAAAILVALPAGAGPAQAAESAAGCPKAASFICGAAEAVVSGPNKLGAAVGEGAAGVVGQGLGALADDAFGQMAQRFGEAGISFLQSLANAFVESSTVDLSRSGIDPVLALTMPIAMLVAVLLVVAAAGRAAVSGQGSVVATALVGLAKTVLVAAMVVTVTQMALRASDELSRWIIARSLGGDDQLEKRLGHLITLDALHGSPALVMLFGLLAIVIGLVLWVELLFRRVAIVVLVALAPIAATGQVLEETTEWWRKTRNALIQLVMLKPVIALCFAVGFSTFGAARDLTGVIAGFVTLGLAAVAWPLLAKFMTFTTVGAGSAALGGLMSSTAGFLAGRRIGGAPTSGPASMTGSGYTLALERENDAVATQGGALAASRGGAGQAAGGGAAAGSGGALAAVGAAATAGAAVLDHMESHANNAAADAGLGHGSSPSGSYGATAGRFTSGARHRAASGASGGTTHLPPEGYGGRGHDRDWSDDAAPIAQDQQEGAPL